jgi:hypothetical protein
LKQPKANKNEIKAITKKIRPEQKHHSSTNGRKVSHHDAPTANTCKLDLKQIQQADIDTTYRTHRHKIRYIYQGEDYTHRHTTHLSMTPFAYLTAWYHQKLAISASKPWLLVRLVRLVLAPQN